MKKVLLTTVMSLMMCMGVFAQTQPDYMKAPKSNEKILGTISLKTREKCGSRWTEEEAFIQLLKKARTEYPNRVVEIREMIMEEHFRCNGSCCYWCDLLGKVVYTPDPEAQTYESLSQALNKALRNVREGSRLAIDQVSVPYSMEKETLKDQLLDLLLDKGYKVIAKDYLDKLYEEQQAQQSGIYNDNTTVQDNNFSAVGYYINVKVTETSLRVQVVNVSTGEYEGNATVNF